MKLPPGRTRVIGRSERTLREPALVLSLSWSSASGTLNGPNSTFATRPGQEFVRLMTSSIDAEPSSQCQPALSRGGGLVDETTQCLDKVRHSLDFFEGQNVVFMAGQVEISIAQLFAIHRILLVQIDTLSTLGFELCQRRLARPARSGQYHCGGLVQPGTNEPEFGPQHHPLEFGFLYRKYKEGSAPVRIQRTRRQPNRGGNSHRSV